MTDRAFFQLEIMEYFWFECCAAYVQCMLSVNASSHSMNGRRTLVAATLPHVPFLALYFHLFVRRCFLIVCLCRQHLCRFTLLAGTDFRRMTAERGGTCKNLHFRFRESRGLGRTGAAGRERRTVVAPFASVGALFKSEREVSRRAERIRNGISKYEVNWKSSTAAGISR